MTTLYITRHGETQWNIEKKMQGWQDSQLTELGRLQAQWLGERLKDTKIDAVYSSPLGRACETARIICRGRDLKIIKEDAFKEINLGNWEGKSQEEIEVIDKEQLDNFWYNPQLYVPSSGESFEEVISRTRKCIEEIIEKHKRHSILIVTHAVALKAIMLYFEQRTLEQFWDPPFMHQTSLSVIEIEEDSHKVILHADTSHYQE